MFRTMEECTNFIFQLKASMYKGEPLESAQKLLAALQHPERKSKFIHFAGSNGKGSTLNMTREILMAHGLTVGAFTSPHLERANERVTINKQEISDEAFLKYANRLAQAVKTELNGQFPSFFEVVTLIALQYFAEQDVDVVLLETGIGGRLDSTNVVISDIAVITTISLEHTDLLGDTYEQIALEKAGILKQNKPAVIGVSNKEARLAIKQVAKVLQVPSFILDEQIPLQKLTGNTFIYKDWPVLTLAMDGEHQKDNAALAIQASELFVGELQFELVQKALQQASWAGRFEKFGKQIIIDGAHNLEGTTALIGTLQKLFPNKHYHFIYAALQDKDHAESIHLMDTVASTMAFTQINMPRAAKAEQLAIESSHLHKTIAINWQQLVEERLASLAEDDLLIITGSLYFISEVRPYLQQKEWSH